MTSSSKSARLQQKFEVVRESWGTSATAFFHPGVFQTLPFNWISGVVPPHLSHAQKQISIVVIVQQLPSPSQDEVVKAVIF